MNKFFQFKSLTRYLLVIFACLCIKQAKAQVVNADPALVGFDITNQLDLPVTASLLNMGLTYKLHLQLTNTGPQAIPIQTTELIIGLGLYLDVAPGFNLATAPLNNYFNWTRAVDLGGQVTIIGNLHTPLPQSFFAYEAVFDIKPLNTTPSGNAPSITGNWSISNNNPPLFLNDGNSNNNTASIDYRVVAGAPLPVTLLDFNAVRKDCNINANWKVENEKNFDRYELQVSKDGTNFETISTAKANSNADYNTAVSINSLAPQLRSNSLMVRLKMIDIDGHFKYSKVVTVSGNCNGKSLQEIYAYPNPVKEQNFITIASKGDAFDGKYKLVLTDVAGKTYSVKQVELSNVSSLRYDVSNKLAAGKYFINVQKADGSASGVVQFEKL